MPSYDYKCKCGKEFERRCVSGLRHAQYCECGELAEMDIAKSMPGLLGMNNLGQSTKYRRS
jgi:hypothetical protein